VASAIGAVSAAEFPRVHRVRQALLSGGKARFTWALRVLLEGVSSERVAGAAKKRR
jgi:hypothetical protein